jgi:hypothetical protein
MWFVFSKHNHVTVLSGNFFSINVPNLFRLNAPEPVVRDSIKLKSAGPQGRIRTRSSVANCSVFSLWFDWRWKARANCRDGHNARIFEQIVLGWYFRIARFLFSPRSCVLVSISFLCRVRGLLWTTVFQFGEIPMALKPIKFFIYKFIFYYRSCRSRLCTATLYAADNDENCQKVFIRPMLNVGLRLRSKV